MKSNEDLEKTAQILLRLYMENARMRSALELIATPQRPDGTWNRDRQACYLLAQEALKSG